MTTDDFLQQGITDFEAGQKAEARAMFIEAIKQDQSNEQAWLWMSGVAENNAERRTCLQRVLALNPSNAIAQRGLEDLDAPPPSADEWLDSALGLDEEVEEEVEEEVVEEVVEEAAEEIPPAYLPNSLRAATVPVASPLVAPDPLPPEPPPAAKPAAKPADLGWAPASHPELSDPLGSSSGAAEPVWSPASDPYFAQEPEPVAKAPQAGAAEELWSSFGAPDPEPHPSELPETEFALPPFPDSAEDMEADAEAETDVVGEAPPAARKKTEKRIMLVLWALVILAVIGVVTVVGIVAYSMGLF